MFEEDSYYIFKVCQLLMSESNLNDFLKENDTLCTSDFMFNFLICIIPFIENKFLSQFMKNNILKYLNYVRFNDNEELNKKETLSKDAKINLVNDIIRMINSADCDNHLIYYREEMYKRTNNKLFLLNPLDSWIMENEKKLFDSMKLDYFIIYSHSDAVEEQEFDNIFIPELLVDFKYFESINCIIKEYPMQLVNPLFFSRYKKVIENFMNKELDDKERKEIVQIDKKIVKSIKRIK